MSDTKCLSREYIHNRNKEDNMNLEFEGKDTHKISGLGGGIDIICVSVSVK